MEDKVYYTPNIEDLHVGYICQKKNGTIGRGNYFFNDESPAREIKWDDEVIQIRERNDRDVVDIEINETNYRVAYLNEEDLAKLGWNKEEWYFVIEVDDRCYSMYSSFFEGNHEDRLWCINNENSGDVLFNGAIKSINELKMIMKFTEITHGNK